MSWGLFWHSLLTGLIPQSLFFLFILSPFVLGWLAWFIWLRYIQAVFLKKQEWILLEIKVPKEITKSPQAMEIVLGAFHQTRDGTFYSKFVEGLCRSWFSLEIVSRGGSIHFYVWTQKFFKNLIESQIYSQYPNVEIYEVDDYTREMPYGLPGSDWDLWGCNFTFTKEDAYPIKTYVDYGMDKDPKEEYKIDPITPVIEFLGSVRPGEEIWIQILIMAARKRFRKKGSWFKKVDWKGDAEKLLEKLLKRDKKKKNGDKLDLGEFGLSSGERKAIEAVERNISKLGFDCGIRAVYLAKKDIFNPINIVGLLSTIKQYNSLNLNGFKPTKTTGFEYPWQDPFKIRLPAMKWSTFDAYRRRAYFYPPYQSKPITLNAEELATIYHFPGQVAETPTLGHIESRRGEPPVNLPL